ncbi:protein DEFECTIVE IN EXINE FORMATION 1 isoform X2 [Strongylocentrotus purpuratus]|uniref:DEX1 C-terminal domain-containing protein n=1 Tax=Strongylocentrotus purpuratus TaxID=7668 RepID=A0A7M7TG69_STRPU|nr:protein DEFECTIVE IN EXINE FORMATION 1 isoform X2 [Strongylocentrotus purpuratus]
MPLLAHFARNMCYLFLLLAYSFKAEGDENSILSCHFDVDIIQSHHVGNSPIVSSPLVADIDADGTLDIITTTFDGTVDVVDGENMKPHSRSQWPYQFPNSTVHASPMLFDVDGDGLREVVVFTTDGEINYFKSDGTFLPEKTVQIPPLWVSKEWINEESLIDTSTTISQFVRTSSDRGYQTNNFIACDAHILATPALTDLDGDGREEELALPVSYYDQLESPRDEESGENIQDIVVGGLVILNLTSGHLIKEVPLHLSKQSAPSPAYLLYPPTVVDLDGHHGPPEVIIATASGLLHAMDSMGRARSGFPVRLEGGAITGQITVDDLDNDGNLEMIVLQTSGDVSCFSNHGNKMWSSKVSGGSMPGSRLADLDDDGVMDVIIPTRDGNVWALSGKTGTRLPHWPVHVGSRLVSNVVITSLINSSQGPSVITTGYDGNLYIISSSSDKGKEQGPCIEAIELGESSLTPVHMADMIPSMPGVEMIAATTHGSIMLMSTQKQEMESVELEDIRWMDATNDKQFAYKQAKYGVFVRRETRQRSYISGTSFTIDLHIEDENRPSGGHSYVIQVFAGSICLQSPVTYSQPGLYSLQVATPNHPITVLVEVHMTNQHGQIFVDSFPVSFNTKVTDDIQWMLVIPTIAMAILLLVLYGYPEVDLLPTSHTSKER